MPAKEELKRYKSYNVKTEVAESHRKFRTSDFGQELRLRRGSRRPTIWIVGASQRQKTFLLMLAT
jgi:hypothetical protein